MKNIKETKRKIIDALEDKSGKINLLGEAHKLTNKKLREEIEGIEEQIQEFSYGRFELMWREALWKEAESRCLEI